MRLAVDARLMAGHPRGMGQYSRVLVEPVQHQLTALLPRSQTVQEWPCYSKGSGFFPWWEQRVLPRMAQQCDATHLLCPNNTGPIARIHGIKTILVVHDLIFLQPFSELPASRSLYQNLGRIYRRFVVPAVIKNADLLITVSEYTREALCEYFCMDPQRIHVIPNSVGNAWFVSHPLDDSLRKPYLLSVTGEAPSKNLSALLKAFAEMRANGFGRELSLRIVGIKPAFHSGYLEEAEQLRLVGAVRLESFISEDELRRMYREAWAFVLPSLFEGFGIPLIEAMASGTPVVCSDTTSLPEVVGDAAILFNPRYIDDMAAKLARIVADRTVRAIGIQKGLKRAEMFRQEAIMQKITDFWSQII
jgi:glycosyltransferase involved in cell wall biosynthesis